VLRGVLAERGLTADDTSIALAGGSARRLLETCDPEYVAHRDHFVGAVLSALAAPDLGATLQMAAAEQLERAGLTRDLRALGQHFALSARQHVGAQPNASLRDAQRYQEVLGALDALEHNSPPVLALEAMVARLRRI
jgi:hypothetical protein